MFNEPFTRCKNHFKETIRLPANKIVMKVSEIIASNTMHIKYGYKLEPAMIFTITHTVSLSLNMLTTYLSSLLKQNSSHARQKP